MRIAVIAAIVVVAAAAGFALGQTTQPNTGLQRMRLPLDLPAVGNIDAVRKWRIARIESIERSTGDDIRIQIRLANGQVERVVGPRQQLAALGRACGWVRDPNQTVAGRADYVERLIALDVDQTGRIIAVISMEPFNRNRRRLERAFGCR